MGLSLRPDESGQRTVRPEQAGLLRSSQVRDEPCAIGVLWSDSLSKFDRICHRSRERFGNCCFYNLTKASYLAPDCRTRLIA